MPAIRLSEESIVIATQAGPIRGDLTIPDDARGVVLFAHGSGSSRRSSRNRFVAGTLQSRGFATLLFDLLSDSEERLDERTRQHRFDIPLLARRVGLVGDELAERPMVGELPIGYFGASTGAAAALVAAAKRPQVAAVVSRGGRPDLAGPALSNVHAATLLIVGERDEPVIELNEEAFARLTAARMKRLEIVPGATHLFEEPGTLAIASRLAGDWFEAHLGGVDGSFEP